MDQFDTKTNNTQKVFYYKMVAKSVGKMYSIYDGKTEYALGQSMYQEAREQHQGGFYVYPQVEYAIFADIKYKKGGLYLAPRTVLKCLCWGKSVEYDNNIISFSNICPIQDLGLPQGYKSSKAALRDVVKKYEDKLKKQLTPQPIQHHVQPKQHHKIRPQSAFKPRPPK